METTICYRIGIGFLLTITSVQAQFAPLPPFTVYGEVRNWNGRAFSSNDAVTIIAKVDGIQMDRCDVVSGTYAEINYRLHVPMATHPQDGRGDRGDPISFDVYYDGQIHSVFSAGTMPVVGQPAGTALCNLFVATDSDADGLPDEYEYLLQPYYSALGKGSDLSQISPDDDFDGDGFSNLDEFYAGTIPVDPSDFLKIDAFYPLDNDRLALSFLAAPGRAYTVPQSANLSSNVWSDATFAFTTNALPNQSFYSSDADTYTTLYLISTNHAIFRLETQ